MVLFFVYKAQGARYSYFSEKERNSKFVFLLNCHIESIKCANNLKVYANAKKNYFNQPNANFKWYLHNPEIYSDKNTRLTLGS